MSFIPRVEPLLKLTEKLDQNRIEYCLGGSALLACHGIIDEVEDWDITTEAPLEKIQPLITEFDHSLVKPSGIFATKYLFKINIDNTYIDLMGSFALKTDTGIFHVKTASCGLWKSLPLGDLNTWAKAYDILGRKEKSQLILNYLGKKSGLKTQTSTPQPQTRTL